MDDQANSRGGGLDLHVDTTAGGGVRAGLEAALREAVRSGRLPPGTRLPPSRTLAADLGIARNTVADAYGQLVAEGWLAARQGSGTRVAERWPDAADAAPPGQRGPATAFPRGRDAASARRRIPYDLRPGSPDLSSFPRTAWLAAVRQALRTAPDDAFGYGDPRGRPELRRELSTYLARARGVRADPERVLVCSGFMQGVGLLGRALRAGGARRMAVEALGFPDTRAALERAGLAISELPVDGGGARIDALGAADAVLLTPAHQYPTGVPLAPARRTAVVGWARRTGGTIVEDDYDGEFRYDRQAVGALQGLDPSCVVYGGTASKSLAPGLRLAWLVLPDRLLDAVTQEKQLADHLSPVVEQLALTELMASGAWDRHVRRMRRHYRERRDRLVAALAERVPGARVTGISAGLHAMVELPAGARPAAEVVAAAAVRGLALTAPPSHRPAAGAAQDVPATPACLVIGFGTPPDHAFGGALDRLCTVLAEAGAG